MAGLRTLLSVLLVCISYHAITAAHILAPRETKNDNSAKFSPRCGSTIATVSMMPKIQTCINFAKLFPIHSAETNVSTPIKAWISGVCATEACTDESLKEALAELSKGCAAELTNKSPHAGALFSILSHYKDIRSTSCKDTEKLDFCQPDLVGSVEKLEKTGRTFFTVSAQAYCTECDKKSASEKPKSSGKKGGAEKPNPPSKRSLTKKNSLHICSGSNLDDKRVEVGLPGPQKKTDAPASPPASPDESN
ncbi:hypothetical protein PGT21_017634 [Puccinia graminis f. sp. tritici]|uniref:Uncharacterized protein n=1 Tax=Puccinia graminis f. sp. tritici TaxID=56615 RepID=A0A5B0MC74_PUCGR|nr:hypothetical protein PGT21_017634 [Puccinia graminis f. sp. tritici]